jgi:hypothetical protein
MDAEVAHGKRHNSQKAEGDNQICRNHVWNLMGEKQPEEASEEKPGSDAEETNLPSGP